MRLKYVISTLEGLLSTHGDIPVVVEVMPEAMLDPLRKVEHIECETGDYLVLRSNPDAEDDPCRSNLRTMKNRYVVTPDPDTESYKITDFGTILGTEDLDYEHVATAYDPIIAHHICELLKQNPHYPSNRTSGA